MKTLSRTRFSSLVFRQLFHKKDDMRSASLRQRAERDHSHDCNNSHPAPPATRTVFVELDAMPLKLLLFFFAAIYIWELGRK